MRKFTCSAAAAILLMAWAWPTAARADTEEPSQYTLTTWTARDGLPSSYVLSLAQDQDGFLWVGTNGGLVRFDGQRFTPWPRAGAFPSPVPLIYAVSHARDGSLWVAAGSQVIRERNGKMTVYTPSQGPPQITRSIIESRDGTIWASGSTGLARFRNERWETIPVPGASGAAINTIHEDREGRLWVSAAGKVVRLENGRFVPIDASTEGAVRFTESGQSMLVTSAARRLSVIGVGAAPQPEPLVSLPVSGVNGPYAWTRASWRDLALPALLDRRGNLWVGTNGDGLVRIDIARRAVSARYTERDGLSGDLVRAVLEDRDGNIWVGTHSGLTRVTPSSIRSIAVRVGATAEDISTIEADPSGAVWIEAPGALVRLADGRRTAFTEGAGAQFDRISAMHTDAAGVFWVATSDGHVVRYVGQRFQLVPLPAAFGTSVNAFASDRQGNVWMYGGGRLLKLNAATNDTAIVTPPPDITSTLVRFIYADSKGRLWLAGDGARLGVYDQGTFRVLTESQGVAPGNPTGIYEEADGRIWISSDSGLSTVEHDRVITLSTANGLPRNRAFFVVGDADGRVWVGTGSGLVRIEREELDKAVADSRYHMRFRFYDASDGLRGTPVTRGYPNAVRTRDGIWFVTSTGVSVADPRQLRDAPAPVPRIEQVVIDGRPMDVRNGATLPSNVASLQIEYAALMLTAPTKVRFRHRLDGVDADWVEDGDARRTVYAHLRDGNYTFRVAASGGDGRWDGQTAGWTFVVPPMWYQTRVFYVALVVALGLTVWGTWQLRERQIKRRFADVLQERARVGREIHDTLLQSLVGMGLQLDTVAKTEDPGALKEELRHIRQQVQHYVGEAQQSIWDLRSPRLESGDLAARLRERAERILHQAGIGFDFSITGTPRPLAAHVEQQILRIGMEAVVNAIRHAQASHIRMELTYDGGSVRLRVSDDGHGFNPEAVYAHGESHWGLSIMRERAEQMGGRFTVASAPDRGTSIEIVAPSGA